MWAAIEAGDFEASMRPPQFAAENENVPYILKMQQGASMRPPQFAAENDQRPGDVYAGARLQ